MKIFAVIDTNVIISALLTKYSDSATKRVLDSFFENKITMVYNDKIISEYNEVMNRKKFNFKSQDINTIIDSFKCNGVFYKGIKTQERLPDPKDIVFYEVVLDARTEFETYLVTGNLKHFPVRPFVITPAQLIEVLEKSK